MEPYFITMKRSLKHPLWHELTIILDDEDKKRIKKVRKEVIEKVWPTPVTKQPSSEEWVEADQSQVRVLLQVIEGRGSLSLTRTRDSEGLEQLQPVMCL